MLQALITGGLLTLFVQMMEVVRGLVTIFMQQHTCTKSTGSCLLLAADVAAAALNADAAVATSAA